MLTKERFKDLIYMMQEFNELYDKLHDLGIDVIECKYLEYPCVFFDELMKSEFGIEGLDTISWWLYEDVDHKIYEPTDKKKEFYELGEEIDGNIIADLNEIDSLYDYLIDNCKVNN